MSTTRWGSVLLAGIKPSWLGRLLGGGDFERSQAAMGGVWVGGRITVWDDRVTFDPAWWDRYLHLNLQPITVPVSAMRRVSIREQGITGTVFAQHTHGEFIFRCYRAAQAATELSEKIQRQDQHRSLAA